MLRGAQIAQQSSCSAVQQSRNGLRKTWNARMTIYRTQKNISRIRNAEQIIQNGKTWNDKSGMVEHGMANPG